MAIGVRAFGLFDERRYVLSVLSDILGGSMSSRLFKKIRDEMGAAYYIKSSPDLYSDYGLLSVSSGIDKERLPEITRVIMDELESFRENLVPEEELNKAKEHISGRLALQLETSDQVAEFYGGEEAVTGSIKTPNEVLEKIKAITSENIMTVAREIITNERINLAVIGSISDKAKEETQKAFKVKGI